MDTKEEAEKEFSDIPKEEPGNGIPEEPENPGEEIPDTGEENPDEPEEPDPIPITKTPPKCYIQDIKLNNSFLPKKTGLNPYFSYMGENKSNTNEQNITDSLIREYIQQFGMKVIYLIRDNPNIDAVYGESPGSSFEKSFEIEMMMKDYTAGFGGRDAVMAFGYGMQDTITMECSFSRLNEELKRLELPDRDSYFPQPGDLLYLPLYKTMMEIRFVDSKFPNQPAGIQVLYTFTCHMYNPNSETFNTEIPDIDIINEFDKIYNEGMNEESKTLESEAETLIVQEPNAWTNLLK